MCNQASSLDDLEAEFYDVSYGFYWCRSFFFVPFGAIASHVTGKPSREEVT